MNERETMFESVCRRGAPSGREHRTRYSVPRTQYTVLRTPHRVLSFALGAIVASMILFHSASHARACSIPVFRFALERWASDLYEVDVFHRGELTPDQRQQLSAIEDLATANGGPVNLEIVRCHVDGPLASDLAAVWNDAGDAPLPHVVIRAPGGRRGSPQVWSGPLAEFSSSIVDSPAKQELVRRLAAGDSVVWLVLPGTDAEEAQAVMQRLEQSLSKLAEEIPIPNGVGLPGSELAARIPLAVKFSALVVDAKSDALWRAQIQKIQEPRDGHPWASGETLVVPVFGRGRALQTLRSSELDEDAIAEISRFLCGACSCQVKELNPGFDLLLSVNWDERLFAPGDTIPTEPPPTGDADAASELVAIAPGHTSAGVVDVAEVASASAVADDLQNSSSDVPKSNSERGHFVPWMVLVAVIVLGCVVIVRKLGSGKV